VERMDPIAKLMRCRRITRRVPARLSSRRINVNEYSPQTRFAWNVKPLLTMRACPDIILQFASRMAHRSCRLRKFGSTTTRTPRAWAFYSERLGRKLAFYQDPYSEYGA